MSNNKFDDLEDIQSDGTEEPMSPSKKGNSDHAAISEIFSYIKIFSVAIIISLILNNFIIVNADVPTGSMKDTIMEHSRLIGFRFSYQFSEPERGDVVIFKWPDDESQKYIKRIIGTPGDTVVIKNGHVYVNGNELEEPYLKEPMAANGQEMTYHVPEDHYFMMGDNRNVSEDSRFWQNTFVAKDKILAKAIFIYYNKHLMFDMIRNSR